MVVATRPSIRVAGGTGASGAWLSAGSWALVGLLRNDRRRRPSQGSLELLVDVGLMDETQLVETVGEAVERSAVALSRPSTGMSTEELHQMKRPKADVY
jgi:hypothetical protein